MSTATFKNPRAKHNFQGRSCSITSVGSYVPKRTLKNADLEKLVETTDEWIVSRTGIRERHIAAESEYTSDMATQAALRAMQSGSITPEQIDLIIVATITPDMPFPATACLVQQKIGAKRAAAFDIEAACSGFIYALEVGQQFIMSRTYETVLVIGAEKLSSIIDWSDRNTCVLFGDGAGAVVLQLSTEPYGQLSCVLGASGKDEDLMAVDAGGTRLPATPELLEQGRQYVYMNGREIFKLAVRGMGDSSLQAIERAGLTTGDIALVVPHQANLRIIDATAKRLGVPMERVFVNLDRYGNTSAATIPIALVEAAQQGRIKHGDYVLLTAFGGGLTWASAVIRWGRPS